MVKIFTKIPVVSVSWILDIYLPKSPLNNNIYLKYRPLLPVFLFRWDKSESSHTQETETPETLCDTFWVCVNDRSDRDKPESEFIGGLDMSKSKRYQSTTYSKTSLRLRLDSIATALMCSLQMLSCLCSSGCSSVMCCLSWPHAACSIFKSLVGYCFPCYFTLRVAQTGKPALILHNNALILHQQTL